MNRLTTITAAACRDRVSNHTLVVSPDYNALTLVPIRPQLLSKVVVNLQNGRVAYAFGKCDWVFTGTPAAPVCALGDPKMTIKEVVVEHQQRVAVTIQ